MSVYLIHFNKPYKHAQHYVGYTHRAVRSRIAEHRANRGARLIEVVNQAGITWVVAKVWHGAPRRFERQLKNRHGASQYCPICCGKGKQSRL